LQDSKFITFLKGYSGCTLSLFEKDGALLVRKVSKSAAYNQRLEAQMAKQDEFGHSLQNGKVLAPKVLGSGIEKGLFYFDMEYVRGRGLADCIAEADVGGIEKISEDICSMVASMKKMPKQPGEAFWDATVSKADSILSDVQRVAHASKHAKLVERLGAMARQKKNSGGDIPGTFCHGDLTLENIVCDEAGGKYYLLDFLDSYYPHYCFDVAKLFQDLEGGWVEFRRKDISWKNARGKMDALGKRLAQPLLMEDEFCRGNYYFLLALTFARILPYSAPGDEEYIAGKVKLFLEKAEASAEPFSK